jgi:hypothetical protein
MSIFQPSRGVTTLSDVNTATKQTLPDTASVGYINVSLPSEEYDALIFLGSSGEINVKDITGNLIVQNGIITQYGASKGAGVAGTTTTTAGIQEALNVLGTNPGLIFVRPGSYPVTTQISIPANAHLAIVGSGYKSTIIQAAAPFSTPMVYLNKSSATISLFIEGIQFSLNGQTLSPNTTFVDLSNYLNEDANDDTRFTLSRVEVNASGAPSSCISLDMSYNSVSVLDKCELLGAPLKWIVNSGTAIIRDSTLTLGASILFSGQLLHIIGSAIQNGGPYNNSITLIGNPNFFGEVILESTDFAFPGTASGAFISNISTFTYYIQALSGLWFAQNNQTSIFGGSQQMNVYLGSAIHLGGGKPLGLPTGSQFKFHPLCDFGTTPLPTSGVSILNWGD